jgi:hypothetical protein
MLLGRLQAAPRRWCRAGKTEQQHVLAKSKKNRYDDP